MTSGALNATPSHDPGGRAAKPGRRRAFAGAAVIAVILAAALALLLSGGGGSTHEYPAQSLTFGSLPSWLPESARRAVAKHGLPSIEQASAAHPVLAEEQGYTVHATVASGTADVMTQGPVYPAYVANYGSSGQWPASKLVPSTFFVTFSNVTGTIPVSAKAFSAEDQSYQQFPATLTVKGGGRVPSAIKAGQTVTLEVHTKTLEGQGAMAWAPLADGKALIAWIYQLELD